MTGDPFLYRPLLIFQHAPSEHPGLFQRVFESHGIPTRILFPSSDSRFPSIEEISGLVSMGGPMSALDQETHPWLAKEKDFIAEVSQSGLPFIGVCLGGQLLAQQLGSKVKRTQSPEVGWYPLKFTEEAQFDPIFGILQKIPGITPFTYHWHEDTFELPLNATLLASTEAFQVQAFRTTEQVYGVQFHPEVDQQLLREWSSEVGMSEDIEEQLKRKCSSVQDLKEQLHYASIGDKANAVLVLLFTQLFRQIQELAETKKNSPATITKEQWDFWIKTSKSLNVELDGTMKGRTIQATPLLTVETALVSFVLFQTPDSRLWPLREGFFRIAPENG